MAITNKDKGQNVVGGLTVLSGGLASPAGTVKVQNTTITTAQVKALNATPITVVTGPAAGYAAVLVGVELMLDFATTAYDGIAAGEDLVLKYTDASGDTVATVETTGFLDATADAFRYVYPASTAAITPVAEADIVAHILIDEIATGDSPLKVRAEYKVIPIAL